MTPDDFRAQLAQVAPLPGAAWADIEAAVHDADEADRVAVMQRLLDTYQTAAIGPGTDWLAGALKVAEALIGAAGPVGSAINLAQTIQAIAKG